MTHEQRRPARHTKGRSKSSKIEPCHVGIDINDLRSVKSHYAGYYDDTSGNFHNLTLASFEAMQVWVDYDGGSKKIDVTLAPLQMAKPKKPLVSTTYDL